MGSILSNICNNFYRKTEIKCLIGGTKSSGKSTILENLNFCDEIIVLSVFSFTIKNLQYQNLNINIWEVEEGFKIRTLWGPYFYGTHGLIFVVDSSDSSKIHQAREELQRLLCEEELKEAVLLVFANMQDNPNAQNSRYIADALGLSEIRDREWKIQDSCAIYGDGLKQGLDWFCEQIKNKKYSL